MDPHFFSLATSLSETYLKLSRQDNALKLLESNQHNEALRQHRTLSSKFTNFFTSHTKYVSSAITLHSQASRLARQRPAPTTEEVRDLYTSVKDQFIAKVKDFCGKNVLSVGDFAKFIKKLNDQPGDHHFHRMIAMALSAQNDTADRLVRGIDNATLFKDLKFHPQNISLYKTTGGFNAQTLQRNRDTALRTIENQVTRGYRRDSSGW